ncbi:MAG: hypothetical protein GX102_04735 [Porphyromonadaceae bacterium]|nr:hypothetical protein [Porphyromonadaceae bacterium]
MFGFTIIKKQDLKFKDEHIQYLSDKVKQLQKELANKTPIRGKDGKFCKKVK